MTIVNGILLVSPSTAFVDRTTQTDGAIVPLIIWVVIGAIGMGWQFRNIERWTSAARSA